MGDALVNRFGDTVSRILVGAANNSMRVMQTQLGKCLGGLWFKSLVMAFLLTGLGAWSAAWGAEACSTVSTNGLVAWWRGENNALDSAGGHDGTLQSGATFATGEIGRASCRERV